MTPMVILCDFDDTVADRNVARMLLEQFYPGDRLNGWRRLHQQFMNAEITLAAYQEQAFSELSTSEDELAARVREASRLRPGFVELAQYCTSNGIGIAIVSHGLELYIRALLDHVGLAAMPVFAVKTAREGSVFTYAYPFARPGCSWWPGNCKCAVMESYRKDNDLVLYAGDGASDICPAQNADHVFARDVLLRFCQDEGLPHEELLDFHVVLDYLERALGAPGAPGANQE